MAKGRRVSGIFVPIQLDTSAVQRDMENLGSQLSTSVSKISRNLEGALNPKQILKGVVDLNKAMGELRDSSKIWQQMGEGQSKFEQGLRELRPQLRDLAEQFGGTIKQQREMYTLLVQNQAVKQEVSALKTWQKQLGVTEEKVVELMKARGQLVSSAALKEFLPEATIERAKNYKEIISKTAEEYRKFSEAAGLSKSQAGFGSFAKKEEISQAISSFKQLYDTTKLSREELTRLAQESSYSAEILATLFPRSKAKEFSNELGKIAAEYRKLAEAAGVAKSQAGFENFVKKGEIAQAISSFKQLYDTTKLSREEVERLTQNSKYSAEILATLFPRSQVKEFTSDLGRLAAEYRKLAQTAGATPSQAGFENFVNTKSIAQAIGAFQKLNAGQKITAENFAQIAKAAGVSEQAVAKYVAEMSKAASVSRGWAGIFTPTSLAAGAQSAMASLGVVGGMYGVVELGKAMAEAALKMDNLNVAFKSIYKSSELATAQLQYVKDVSDKLGVSFLASSEGAKKLFASAQGTELQDNVNDIFKSFSTMGAALKLTGDEMNSVFLAVSQMISKGKVSAEELRLQLAERMPGAVQLFARAIDVSTTELDDMLQKGKVGLSELVKFAKVVQETYSAGAQEASSSLQAQLARAENAWFDLKKAFVDTDAAANAVSGITSVMKSLTELAPVITSTVSALAKLAAVFGTYTIVAKITPLLATFGKTLLDLTAASATTKLATMFSTIISAANPIALTVASLTTLGFAIQAIDSAIPEAKTAVSDYATSFRELEKEASGASNAVANTATAAFRRQVEEYQKAVDDLKAGVSGGFSEIFDKIQRDVISAAVLKSNIPSVTLIDQEALITEAKKAVSTFSETYNKALKENDKVTQQIAIADLRDTMSKLSEEVQSSNLPDKVKENIDKSFGGIINLVTQVEQKFAGLATGEAAAAVERIGVNLPNVAREFSNIMKMAENTNWEKAFKDTKELDSAVDSLGNLANMFVIAQDRYATLEQQYIQGRVTIEELSSSSSELSTLQEKVNQAMTATAAIASSNGVSLETLKGKIADLGAKYEWATPVLESFYNVLSQGMLIANQVDTKKISDQLNADLKKWELMGRKANDPLAISAKREQELSEYTKALKEGKLTHEQYEKATIAVDAALSRLAANAGNAGAKAHEKAAKQAENYADTLKALSEEVRNLENAYEDQSVSAKEAMLLADKNTAIAKAQAKASTDLRNKSISVAQSEQYIVLSTKKAELEYAIKLRDLEESSFKERADFYKQLSDYSGAYEESAEYQLALLEKQAKDWVKLKIPIQDVNKMLEYQRREISRDAFDGLTRGLDKYIAKARDFASQAESMVSNFTNNLEGAISTALDNLLIKGEATLVDFKSLFDAFLSDLIKMTLVRPIVLQVSSIASGALSSLFGTGASAAGASTGAAGAIAQGSDLFQQMAGLGTTAASGALMSSSIGTGFTGWMNSTAASLMPSTFAGSSANAGVNALVGNITGTAGTLPTQTLTSALSSGWSMGSGLAGGLAANYLSPVLGIAQNTGSSIGGMAGSAAGTVAGTAAYAALAAANSWNPVGWGMAGLAGVGALLGGLGGSGLGSLFVGGGDEPGLWVGATVDLAQQLNATEADSAYRDRKHPWDWYQKEAGRGYLVQARNRDGMSAEAAKQATIYLEGLITTAVSTSNTYADSLGNIESSLGEQYKEALTSLGTVTVSQDWEGEEPDVEGLGTKLTDALNNRMVEAFRRVDFSGLADKYTVDTSSIEGIQEFFTAVENVNAIVDATEQIKRPVSDIEGQAKAAEEQLQAFVKSLQSVGVVEEYATQITRDYQQAVIESYIKSITDSLNPLSTFEQQMYAAQDNITNTTNALRIMGATAEQVAQVTGQLSDALNKQREAATLATRQDLASRYTALTGTAEQLTDLKNQIDKANQLAQVEAQYGRGPDWTATITDKVAQLNRDAEQGRTDWTQAALMQAIADAGMSGIEEWYNNYGQAEGVSAPGGSVYDYTSALIDAEQTQAKLTALEEQRAPLQKQIYQEQLSSAQEVLSAWKSVVSGIEDTRRGLWIGDTGESLFTRQSTAQSEFDRLYQAAMDGDEEAAQQMNGLASELLSLNKQTSKNSEDYLDSFYDVDKKLLEVSEYGGKQVSEARKQVDLLDSQLAAINGQTDTLSAQLSVINSSIVTMTTTLATQLATLQSIGSVNHPSGATGPTSTPIVSKDIYGSNYDTEGALIAAKVADLNAGNLHGAAYKPSGDSWTASDVYAAFADAGLTTKEWYEKYGKAEGFATGGITPRNTPFWVGENGPELMMSPRQYGVLNNGDSLELTSGRNTDKGGTTDALVVIIKGLLEKMNVVLSDISSNTRSTAVNTKRSANADDQRVMFGVA